MAKSRTAQEGLGQNAGMAYPNTEWQKMVTPTIHCNATIRADMPLRS